MIDKFIKLIEFFVRLVKSKKEVQHRAFEQLLKPLFHNLEDIHNDYLHLFEVCKRDFEKGTALGDIAERLRVDRLGKEALRRSTSQFAEAYREYPKLSIGTRLFETIGSYMSSTEMCVSIVCRLIKWDRLVV